MGLVTGDSTTRLSLPDDQSDEDDEWERTESPEGDLEEKRIEDYEAEYQQQREEWARKHDMRDSGLPPERGPQDKDWEGHGPRPEAFI